MSLLLIKNAIKLVVPAFVWNFLKGMRSAYFLRQHKLNGQYFCPLCENRVIRFSPLGKELMDKYIQYGCIGERFAADLSELENFSCPHCGGMDRERLVGEYLLGRLGKGFCNPSFKIMEFAPRPAVGAFLQRNFTVCHETSDLFMDNVDYRLDVAAMPQLADASVNAWICLHVLEHVPDDISALKELRRILRPGGFGILLVPLSLTLDATEENLNASEEERWRLFGQDDHIRLYAKKDFVSRLEAVGFVVHACGVEYFGEKALTQIGISKGTLYVCEVPTIEN